MGVQTSLYNFDFRFLGWGQNLHQLHEKWRSPQVLSKFWARLERRHLWVHNPSRLENWHIQMSYLWGAAIECAYLRNQDWGKPPSAYLVDRRWTSTRCNHFQEAMNLLIYSEITDLFMNFWYCHFTQKYLYPFLNAISWIRTKFYVISRIAIFFLSYHETFMNYIIR